MKTSTHTIAALSTPNGQSALAVIRLTGDGAQDVFTGVIREKTRFKNEIARKISLYTVVDNANYDDIHAESAIVGAICDRPPPDVSDITDNTTGATILDRPPPDISDTADDTVGAATCRPRFSSSSSAPIIDEVTAIKYNAPHSFTGEDMVEIFCHGGVAVTGKILDCLFRQGARPAGRGEFSRRAFLNGKIGLLKAESIASLIESQTETRLQSAQSAYQGKQSESLEKLKRRLIAVLADIESRIEFGEDDDVAESQGERQSANKRELEAIIAESEEELRRSDRIKAFDDGITAALAGPANAGKSSLFNEILGYDRSIVHDRPGTTRDIVSERIIFEGVTVKLIDSAGLRDTEDAVEQQGITRTISALRAAHFVLWVTSADEPLGDRERRDIFDIINNTSDVSRETFDNPAVNMTGVSRETSCVLGSDVCCNLGGGRSQIAPTPETPSFTSTMLTSPIVGAICDRPPAANPNPADNILIIINKIDLAPPSEKTRFCNGHSLKYIETSLTQKTNRDQLLNTIGAAIRGITDNIPVPELIVNERHRAIIESITQALQLTVEHFDREEVSAHYLKTALDHLAEFSGHVAGDEVLDEIFGKFCIGK